MSKSGRQVRPAYHRERGSIGARRTIDGFGITLHSLRRGLLDYEVARWAPGELDWIVTCRLTRRNDVLCATSKEKLLIKY